MPELIWMREEETQSEYTEHGRFRAWIARIDTPSEGRVTIRYFIRDMESNTDEKASYVQVPAARAEQVIEGLKTKLESELVSRVGPVEE